MPQSAETLLLLIDLQKAFCDEDGSMAQQGREIATMQAAAKACDGLAETARRSNVPIVWTRMAFAPDYADGGLLTSRLRPNLARIGALKRGTADAGFSDHVAPAATDIVIDKPRYSALYATSLEVELRARGIRQVVVGGVTTSMCVDTTVRDLGQRDHDVLVVADACADFDDDRHGAALAAMAFGFARMASLDEAKAALRGTCR